MEPTKSLEIIERMLVETKKSLHRNSFYFLLWGILLIPAGVAEFMLYGESNFWMVWPAVGMLGGIISMIYGFKESKRAGTTTAGDRITSYTWGAFMFVLVFSIVYAVSNRLPPHALILMGAAMATFISGGISKFRPFVLGGILLALGAIACGFFVQPEFHSLVFSASILLGYVIPGLLLRKSENV